MSELTAEERAELEAIASNLVNLDRRIAESDVATLYRALLASPDALDPAVGRYFYGEVAPACVDPCVREAAEKAVAWCVNDDLVLDYVPSIRWFMPESDLDRAYVVRWQARDWGHVSTKRQIRGCTVHGSNEIWLRADLSIAKVVETAAHEVRHLADEPGTSSGQSELDAHWYEERMGGRLRALIA